MRIEESLSRGLSQTRQPSLFGSSRKLVGLGIPLSALREDRENRWIHVDWADTTTGAYSTTLRILARDRNGLVLDITTVLNSLSAKVLSLNARGLPDGNALILVTLDLSALRLIMGRLRTLGGVRQIERGNG